MKRFMLSATVLLMVGGFCLAHAEASGKAVSPVKTAGVSIKSVSGKIKAVTEADAAKGTKSEISVVSADGAVKALLVKAETTIYDINGKPLTLKDLKADSLVKVKYKTSAEGVVEALAIYQSK